MFSAWGLIVHSSSESIGTIAAALAKAQAELTNPEKIACRHYSFPLPSRRRPDVPLRSAVEWS